MHMEDCALHEDGPCTCGTARNKNSIKWYNRNIRYRGCKDNCRHYTTRPSKHLSTESNTIGSPIFFNVLPNVVDAYKNKIHYFFHCSYKARLARFLPLASHIISKSSKNVNAQSLAAVFQKKSEWARSF